MHGPHDEKFYKFLSELEDEYEALKRSGYAGEGFHSNGRRLGENVSHNVPPHIARARALEAAEKRRRIGGMLGGARRLGGSVVRRDLTPRELAVQASTVLCLDVRPGLTFDVLGCRAPPQGRENLCVRRACAKGG